MNVYDFDDTIYRGDSTFDFIRYLYVHRPLTLISLPRTGICGLLYLLHIFDRKKFKQQMYHMFVYVKDMDDVCDAFVESHMNHIKQWYIDRHREDDLVISASPEFLIGRFCKKLGIRQMMASVVDIYTGKYTGLNCHGEEKVRRFYELYPQGKVEGFWSDSYLDTPLARLAEKAYLVKGDRRIPWPDNKL